MYFTNWDGKMTNKNICKCGHEKEYHLSIIDKGRLIRCMFGDGEGCPCKKFEVENHTQQKGLELRKRNSSNSFEFINAPTNNSKCCNAKFIKESDVCSKCKEHSA